MAIVVSDTSPVRALSHLHLLHLLPTLFGEVLIPPAVQQELAAPSRHFPAFDATTAPEMTIRAPRDRAKVAFFRQTLGPGESEALALALETSASAILVDERKARVTAVAEGLVPLGVIAVLLSAKQKGLVPTVLPLLDRLTAEINFFVSSDLRIQTAFRAGEAP